MMETAAAMMALVVGTVMMTRRHNVRKEQIRAVTRRLIANGKPPGSPENEEKESVGSAFLILDRGALLLPPITVSGLPYLPQQVQVGHRRSSQFRQVQRCHPCRTRLLLADCLTLSRLSGAFFVVALPLRTVIKYV